MRAGDRAKRENQRHERGAGGDRICQQRDGHISAGQALAHDSRADYRGHQEKRSQNIPPRLGAQVTPSLLPDAINFFFDRERIEA